MNKKILIGSTTVVAILIGISFTSVVGYKSVESNVKDSPLFNIRTNRAIGEENNVLNYNYVSKGITLPFPKRDDKAIMVQKVVDSIIKMDDKTFEKFIATIINYAQNEKGFNDVKSDEIREALYLLRDSDKPILIFNTDTKQLASYGPGFPCPITQGDCPITSGYGFKGLLLCILLLPFAVLVVIYTILIGVIPTLLFPLICI